VYYKIERASLGWSLHAGTELVIALQQYDTSSLVKRKSRQLGVTKVTHFPQKTLLDHCRGISVVQVKEVVILDDEIVRRILKKW